MAQIHERGPTASRSLRASRHAPAARGGGAFVDCGEEASGSAALDAEERAWIVAGWADRCSVCGHSLAHFDHRTGPARRVCDDCRVPPDASGRLR